MNARSIGCLVFVGAGLSLMACASTDNDSPSGSSGESSSGTSGLPCRAKTCEDFEGACGPHDDGCNSTVTCGECKAPCTSKTCTELAQTCGTADDGCGGTINCGACPDTGCAKDAKEPNDTKDAATDLGAATDNPNTTKPVPALGSSDGDEDWFKMKVTDSGFGGNPRITATVTVETLEVAVFHVCDSQPDYSYCAVATDAADATVGKGCRAKKTVALETDCKGITETGTTYVRVRKLASDGACVSYDLTVTIE